MQIFSWLTCNRVQYASLASGLVLAAISCCEAQAQTNLPLRDRVYRSVADWRQRIPDELDRPNYHERITHRGYEIVNDYITVIASTSLADAKLAAAEATRAWNEAGLLADHFTKVHRNPNFGIGALQVHIDGEPQLDQDRPLVALNVVGQKSQVVLHTNAGTPNLSEQLPRLREATILAFLRTTELDVQYPNWVSQGMAGYLAEEGETAASLAKSGPKPTTNNIGGQQWRAIRKQPDVLTPAENERAEAVARVRFLLEGDDSEHTPAFFAMLKASAENVAGRRPGEGLVKTTQGEVQPSFASDLANVQISDLKNDLNRWKANPLTGQPVYVPAAGLSADDEWLQREMLVVLKLERRFSAPSKNRPGMKVVSFKPEPRDAAAASKLGTKQLEDPRRLFDSLIDGAHGEWATRDADGSLLMSSNTQRIEALLGDGGRRFERREHGDRWVLAAPLGKGQFMAGWLEENPADPTRPRARFERIDSRLPSVVDPSQGPPQPTIAPPAGQQVIPLRKLTPPGNQPVGEWRAKTVKPNQ
jgi:hypothetical protein